jgi:hypothetical protein
MHYCNYFEFTLELERSTSATGYADDGDLRFT